MYLYIERFGASKDKESVHRTYNSDRVSRTARTTSFESVKGFQASAGSNTTTSQITGSSQFRTFGTIIHRMEKLFVNNIIIRQSHNLFFLWDLLNIDYRIYNVFWTVCGKSTPVFNIQWMLYCALCRIFFHVRKQSYFCFCGWILISDLFLNTVVQK